VGRKLAAKIFQDTPR